ncbi:MAG: Ig-like domain repeat protein [Terriglobales bacterium]
MKLYPSLLLADVNRDGIRDLLVVDQCSGNIDCTNTPANGSVGVLLGNADGSFQPAQTYDSGGRFANSIAVADVNGDGKLDLVVGNQCLSSADCSSGAVTVLLGKSDGTFQSAQAFSSGGYSANSVVVADVNGDGIPDLLVADKCLTSDCFENGQVAVLFGNGDGTFQPAQIYDSGSTTAHSLLAADVNGDGKLDLIVSNSDSVGVLLGNGDGTFQDALYTPASYGYQGHIVAADFDGDGKIDIASSDGSLLLGNGDGTFTATTGLIPPGPGIAVGDLNGDGKPDLAIGGVTILLNIASRAIGTTTSLASSLNPSQVGQDVTFTSIVTPTGQGTPTGSVTFNDGTTVLGTVPLSNGTAALTVSNLTVGTHAIVALYSGDSKFSPSTSPVLEQVVNTASPAVINVTETVHVMDSPSILLSALIVVNENIHVTDAPFVLPSTLIAVNESIHITDAPTIVVPKVTPTINWPTPTPITYGTPLSTTQLDATASVPGTFVYTPTTGTVLGAGNQTLSVLFTPTDTGDYTTATAEVVLVVKQASTSVLLTSSANPQLVGQPVTFTAAISSSVGDSVTGSVVFSADGSPLGTASVSGNTASLTTSFSTNGNHSITATYSGDVNHAGSTSVPLIEVIAAKARTKLHITSSLNPSPVGQGVTFTATFQSAPPPDGEFITFKRGTAVLGTGVIVQGSTSFTTSALRAGASRISAHYLGDGIFGASSAAVTQTVDSYPTTTTLSANPNPALFGQTVNLTATVTTQDPLAPTGTVTFRDAATVLRTVMLSSDGTATFAVNKFPAGIASLTAEYNGDSRNVKSTSSALDETINPASSTTTLSPSRNPSTLGQSVIFTASVTTETGVSATGTATFTAGTTALGTVTLAGGKAHISASSLPRGANTITATYSGSADIEESSATLIQQVN